MYLSVVFFLVPTNPLYGDRKKDNLFKRRATDELVAIKNSWIDPLNSIPIQYSVGLYIPVVDGRKDSAIDQILAFAKALQEHLPRYGLGPLKNQIEAFQ